MFIDDKTDKAGHVSYVDDHNNMFRYGIALQREQFKTHKYSNDYDGMCDAIENIKAEISLLAKQKRLDEEILFISKITKWYRYREIMYSKTTVNGDEIVFPLGMNNIINYRLTLAYEKIIAILTKLDLL